MSGQDGDASLSRTQSAEGTSSGLGGDRSIQTPSEQRITDINTRCREIIKKYKDGIIGKDLAIDELKKIVPGSGEEPTSGAFRAYLSILDNHEAFSRTIGNASRGRNQLLGHLDDGHGTDPATPPTGNRGNPAGVTNIVQPIEELANDQQRGKRSRERRDEDNEEDEDDERPRKKLDLTALPWTIQEASSNRQLSDELKKTRSILENISRDPKSAKSSLLNCFSCPQFPDSEWTNLLAGRSVNLDHVISGLCSLSNEERTSEKIGTVQISLGPAAAVRQVRTHGEWVIVWDKTVRATTFIFPHRESELRAHGEYITGIFAALPIGTHNRVIQFDKAVRVRVGQRRDLELSDHVSFSDLYILWIQSSGPASNTTASKPSTSLLRKRDSCRRWNEGRCPNTSSSCNYAHACESCKASDHTKPNCPGLSKK
jgi:hypothetical protein